MSSEPRLQKTYQPCSVKNANMAVDRKTIFELIWKYFLACPIRLPETISFNYFPNNYVTLNSFFKQNIYFRFSETFINNTKFANNELIAALTINFPSLFPSSLKFECRCYMIKNCPHQGANSQPRAQYKKCFRIECDTTGLSRCTSNSIRFFFFFSHCGAYLVVLLDNIYRKTSWGFEPVPIVWVKSKKTDRTSWPPPEPEIRRKFYRESTQPLFRLLKV